MNADFLVDVVTAFILLYTPLNPRTRKRQSIFNGVFGL